MVLAETDASPMHVGALLVLAVPERRKPSLLEAVRHQFASRLAGRPLAARLQEAPDGYDSDVWIDVDTAVGDLPIRRAAPHDALDDQSLRKDVARRSMQRLNLGNLPFEVVVYDALPGEVGALYFKMHHAVADGIGFQTILHLLGDAAPPVPARPAAVLPAAAAWREAADARFVAEAELRDMHAAKRRAAADALRANPLLARTQTPVLKLTGPTSGSRAYATLQVPLARVKALADALKGTVNDIFLAIAGTAIRTVLQGIDDLPDTPIVANSARSYRRLDHGSFGNRIVAQHPHLATHIADPLARLRAIQDSMAVEKQRTHFDEAMLDAPERPFGARDRRLAFADRVASGRAVLPGNVTISNVPGPGVRASFAGFAQIANYPVPIIGSSRFLNITSRRSGDSLDIGLIVDASRLSDADSVAAAFLDAIAEYEGMI